MCPERKKEVSQNAFTDKTEGSVQHCGTHFKASLTTATTMCVMGVALLSCLRTHRCHLLKKDIVHVRNHHIVVASSSVAKESLTVTSACDLEVVYHVGLFRVHARRCGTCFTPRRA